MRPETKADIIAFAHFLKWVGFGALMLWLLPIVALGLVLIVLAWPLRWM